MHEKAARGTQKYSGCDTADGEGKLMGHQCRIFIDPGIIEYIGVGAFYIIQHFGTTVEDKGNESCYLN